MAAVRTRWAWACDLAGTCLRRFARSGRSIGYIGWTIAENLGDEAMLEGAKQLFPSAQVEEFRGTRREAILARAGLSGPERFERIYLGGGTLINHGYLNTVLRALSFGVPVSTLGTGVGGAGFSADTEASLEGWSEALISFEKIGVRGPRSKARLEAIGVSRADVVGDLAMALTPNRRLGAADTMRFLMNAAAPGAHEPAFPTVQVINSIAAAVRRLVELGWRPVPVAFCPEDVAPTAAVLSAAGLGDLPITRLKNSQSFFAIAQGAGLTVGVRLHSAVLSCCAGIAPLHIAYRDKSLDFAESMDLSDWTLEAAMLSDDVLVQRAEILAGRADKVGEQTHANALIFRNKLRSYVGAD